MYKICRIVVRIYVYVSLAVFDIRIPPTVDQAEFESTIQRWCSDAGTDVTYQFVYVCYWSYLLYISTVIGIALVLW